MRTNDRLSQLLISGGALAIVLAIVGKAVAR